jgi:hypothetical protein
VPEIGEVLDISPATVKREWSVAKLWLERELTASADLIRTSRPMNPERWQRIKDVVADALELSLPARAKFVEQACGEDAELRREVESMVRHSGELIEDFAEDLNSTVGATTDESSRG